MVLVARRDGVKDQVWLVAHREPPLSAENLEGAPAFGSGRSVGTCFFLCRSSVRKEPSCACVDYSTLNGTAVDGGQVESPS